MIRHQHTPAAPSSARRIVGQPGDAPVNLQGDSSKIVVVGSCGVGGDASLAPIANSPNPLMRPLHHSRFIGLVFFGCALALLPAARANVGVGAKPLPGAEVIFDGSRAMLDAKWTYWVGPRFGSALPIKWKIVEDPVDQGTALMSWDPAATLGKFGAADIVTKKAYRDFRLHIEFLVMNPGGNSGVYLQNRYEIQIQDGAKTKHGMGAVINETESPYQAYKGLRQWNSYDMLFRAARFQDGKRVERAQVTMYFNGIKAHTNQSIEKVWGGPNSGIDGGNDGGRGITDTPGGLKLQCEGHDVRFRNAWIKEVVLEKPETDFRAED